MRSKKMQNLVCCDEQLGDRLVVALRVDEELVVVIPRIAIYVESNFKTSQIEMPQKKSS